MGSGYFLGKIEPFRNEPGKQGNDAGKFGLFDSDGLFYLPVHKLGFAPSRGGSS